MQAALRKGLVAAGWRLPLPGRLLDRGVVTLMYHGVGRSADPWGMNADAFERQIRFLKEHFDLVGPGHDEAPLVSNRTRVALTFDDGFRNNAEVVAPILRQYGAPATFFISTRHCEAGKYLWTAYLRALTNYYPDSVLQFRGVELSMSGVHRTLSVRRLREMLLAIEPHSKIYDAIENELPRLESFMTAQEIQDRFAGMTPGQIRELSSEPLFGIGAHTEDHLLLSRCDEEEIRAQLEINKERLEAWSGKPCEEIAYPRSDYDERAITASRAIGFRIGYSAEQPSRFDKAFEQFRTGVYYPSLDELGCKVRWARLWIERVKRSR